MKMRNPVTLVQIAFLTLAAVIAADLIAVMLQWSWTAPPPTVVTARAPAREALPQSVDQVVADTKSLLKDAPAPQVSPAASTSEYGGPGQGPGSAAGPEAAPPDPSQTMTLLGTLVADGASAAFIQIAGNTTTVYEGGTINGYRIVEIRPSSVLLAYGSTEVPLYLPSLIPAKAPVAPQAGVLPPPPAPVAVQTTAPGEPGKVVLPRSDVSATLQHPDEYMKQMRILPYNKDGKPYGMRVMYLQPGSMLNRMGVQAGDIMVSVNGSNLYSVSDAMNAYQTIEKEDHVAFQVERQGKPITLEVDIR